MDDWLAGYERVEITGCTGPGIAQVGNWSVTLHTMEGSIETAIGQVFEPKPCYCPHISVAPRKGRKVQHVPLNWPSAALQNLPGGVETNRAREIQIEIEGFAADSQGWPDDDLRFIGEVLADLVRAGAPIDLDHHPRFVGQADGFIARVDAPQRMSFDEWLAFDGVCGHQHVPENEHWDPGALNIDRVIEHAKASLGVVVEQPKEWDEMATEEQVRAIMHDEAQLASRPQVWAEASTGRCFLAFGMEVSYINDPADLPALIDYRGCHFERDVPTPVIKSCRNYDEQRAAATLTLTPAQVDDFAAAVASKTVGEFVKRLAA